MKLAGRIKPISYFEAHAYKIVKDVYETRTPMILTRDGEGAVIIMDVESYDEKQRALAEASASLGIGLNADKSTRPTPTLPAPSSSARSPRWRGRG